MNNLEILRACGLFKSLPSDETSRLANFFRERSFAKDLFIFQEGDPSDWLYLVKTGKIKMVKQTPDGRDIILEIMGPGDVFGCIAFLQQRPYPASAYTLEDTTVLKLSQKDFLHFAHKHPEIALQSAALFGTRLMDAHNRVRDLASQRVENRLAGALLKLARQAGKETPEGTVLSMPLTRQELADLVGTARETTIRALSHLKQAQILKDHRGQITILNMKELETLAERD